MDKKIISKQVIIEKGGIAKTSDFVAAGIPAVDIVNLCNTGYLERIRHGYYQLADGNTSSEEQLIATLIPKAIICVESALFHYGYSDFAPRKWSIAVPRSMSRTKLDIDALTLQPTMCNRKYMNWAKQLPILTASYFLYMTESVQSAIASNIVQGLIMKYLVRH